MNRLRNLFEKVRPRMTPSVVVIGAQKAGTSALFKMLSRHPKAAPPAIKELDFFNRDEEYAKGMGHYRAQFPPIPAKSFGHFTFEASPSYLYFAETCAPRIAKDLPGVLCVAILRDPVKRAYSAWNMCRDFQYKPHPLGLPDPRPFAQAVEDELAGRTTDPRHKYLLRGQYADQFAHFQTHIPKGDLIVRSYLDLKKEPKSLVNDLCGRLDLPPMKDATDFSGVKANTREYPEPLDKGLAADLYKYFETELQKLDRILGYTIDLIE